eukprot:11174947-Lingulodinium_polyedra.AAC.1
MARRFACVLSCVPFGRAAQAFARACVRGGGVRRAASIGGHVFRGGRGRVPAVSLSDTSDCSRRRTCGYVFGV